MTLSVRILMVSLVDFSKAEGGVNHQLGLLRAWRKQGCSVRLLAPRRAGMEARVGVALGDVEFSMPVSNLGLPKIFDALPQLFYILRSRIRYKSSTLYIRANSFTFIIVIFARLIGMLTVVEHNSWLSSERRISGGSAFACFLDRHFQVWSAKLAHLSRCVTPGIRDLLQSSGVRKERMFVVGNGTNVDEFRPVHRDQALIEMEIIPDRIWLGFIGILVRWQGVDTAIAALAHFDDMPELGLIIAGDGPDRPRLEQLVGDLHLGDRVVFLGKIERNRANLVINSFDLALAPFTRQRNEEIGLSALKLRDYAAAGRVVVAADVPGVRELAGNKWLVLHQPGNPEDLAAVIRALLASREDWAERARLARAYAERHFDWDRLASQILDRVSLDSR